MRLKLGGDYYILLLAVLVTYIILKVFYLGDYVSLK